MALIKNIFAYEILDSRGNPTIACDCELDTGDRSNSAVPSGASTGSLEACELRDKYSKRYRGKGVLKAIKNINDIIAPKLVGLDPSCQEEIDDIMLTLDGSSNLDNLGANAILAVSLAVAQAAAKAEKKEFFHYIGDSSLYSLPVPFMNILNGGEHADNNIDIQEFMIVPVGFGTFSEALRAGTEIYHSLAKLLHDNKLSTCVGDEGGFAPNLAAVTEVFDYMTQAIQNAGYKAGKDIFFAIDAAASEFYKDGSYVLSGLGKSYTCQEWVDFLEELVNRYPIISIEDGMAENDELGWSLLTKRLGRRVQLVGDDLFVTQAKVLLAGIEKELANAILIKPNQVGSLTGTLLTIGLAKQQGYNFMISHRSGETSDTTIADLAVATGAGQIKTGAPCRGERLAKYNRLLEIEKKLGSNAIYTGSSLLQEYINSMVHI